MNDILERDWIPRRADEDGVTAALKNLVVFQEVRISNTTIETEMMEPAHLGPLGRLESFLDRWHFETVVSPISPEGLKELRYPTIAYLDHRWVVLAKRDAGRVRYLDPGTGWRECSVADVVQHADGRLLTVRPGGASAEPDYEVLRDGELEAFATDPRTRKVRTVEDFLDVQECRYFMNVARPFLRASVVHHGDEVVRYGGRTSSSAFLEMQDDRIEEIYERASAVLGQDKRHFEPFHCTRYEEGQEYEPHFDAFEPEHELELQFGQRVATLLVYLSDDFEAGETLFPNLGLRVQPKRGRAIVFRSIDEAGRIDQDSLHAGLPVFSGSKYVLNLWCRDAEYPRRG